ncbi:hypothetical protein B296_00041546 [Ensete ventricosum]|uniref:Uncharacterized protein n=1 Tax=Ensete ventricosum TaxID=4639 RepID=A0A426Z723_ENSVE|nr:hypothetical protein B296_00041546 [Ensete ventricosum]
MSPSSPVRSLARGYGLHDRQRTVAVCATASLARVCPHLLVQPSTHAWSSLDVAFTRARPPQDAASVARSYGQPLVADPRAVAAVAFSCYGAYTLPQADLAESNEIAAYGVQQSSRNKILHRL